MPLRLVLRRLGFKTTASVTMPSSVPCLLLPPPQLLFEAGTPWIVHEDTQISLISFAAAFVTLDPEFITKSPLDILWCPV